jgi:LITAF-like zinc ribbon domain
MITFACPACRGNSDWPDDWLGERVDCPHCGARLELSARRRDDRDDRIDRIDRREVVPRRRRERDHVRDDFVRDDYREDRPRKREMTCPECGCQDVPDEVKDMSEISWVLIVIGIFFWPLLIIGILMKDTWEVCPECRKRLRKVAGPTLG